MNRPPGRPPAGVDGTEVRNYPTIRLEPAALVLVQQVAKAQGRPVHAAASALVRAGARALARSSVSKTSASARAHSSASALECIEDGEDIEDD